MRVAAVVTTVVMVVGLVQAQASAEPRPAPFTPTKPQTIPSVPVSAVKPAAVKRTAMPDATKKPGPVWPAAAEAVANVPEQAPAARSMTGRARVGSLPVYVGRSQGEIGASGARGSGAGAKAGIETPGRVRVRVRAFDRTATDKAGVHGLLLRVGRDDGKPGAAAVDVTVDYNTFRTAYGGDWAARLRLVALPECALTTPGKRECVGRPLPSRNDPSAGMVTAKVPLAASGTGGGTATSTLVAVAADASGSSGDYKATSLQASSTWSAGGNSGDFTWSYPMRVPPAPGGPAPDVGLSYSAQSVDGRHAASNNQPSWVGEGFESTAGGYIERQYETCADDMAEDGEAGANNSDETWDLCWGTDEARRALDGPDDLIYNATLSLAGHSGELIYSQSENRWHLRGDDGSRVQRLTGADNGDNDGEYWVVTTTDGVQYWFGAHNKLPGWTSDKPVTNSTWTVPVFGNHSEEPCHATAFANSDCQQAWRWNLDYVVDLHGNSASYWYVPETNYYARNIDSDALVEYDRGGYLDYIAYATRREDGVDSVFSTSAPAKVDFEVDHRCLSDCATHDDEGVHWPDTPWDQECKSDATDCTVYSPTFWSTKRLAFVTTQLRNGTTYDNVERWTFTHTFPDPGDGTRAGLWLSKISHTGLVGTAVSVPDIEFTGVQLSNRVDTIDFAAAMNWWRIQEIRTETGGTINVRYSDVECVAGSKVPTVPASNALRCYPVRWTPEGYASPVTDYFHKYVVASVEEEDHTGGGAAEGSPPKVTQYDYLTTPAWHYADDDGLIEKKDKTWSGWRGYGKVGVTVGEEGEQTYSEATYFRGMHGDKAASGTRTVPIGGTGVPTVNDEDAYAGKTRETVTFNGPRGAEVARQVFEPWQSAPTASRTINGDTVQARFTGNAASHERTVLDGGRPVRVRTVRSTFDPYGMAVFADDSGDAAVAGDETCAKTTYEPRNTTRWLMNVSHRTQSFAVSCAAAADPTKLTDADVISDTRVLYDGQDYGTTPVRGLATKTEKANAWNAGSPTYDATRAAYDSHGRVTDAWDALDKLTTTAYTPAGGGLATQTEVTNPLSHVTTTTLDPAWGLATAVVDPNLKRTDLTYDGLGRLAGVWLPGRTKGTDSANSTYSYLIRNAAPSVVTTSTLNAENEYLTSHAFFDGLLRQRQTQAPSPSGGRVLTDTYYDTAGREVRKHEAYYNTDPPSTTLATADDAQDVPNQTRSVYDGAGRVIASIFQPFTAERWRTTTCHGGDRTDMIPPDGGTTTSTITDVLGHTIAVRQYHRESSSCQFGAISSSEYDETTYTVNRKGQQSKVTDAAGNHWDYTYDLRGRTIVVSDPDKGDTTNTYNAADQLTSTTDDRGIKLLYTYDALGRRTAIYQNAIAGLGRARWIYDTVAKGQLSSATRYVGSTGYARLIDEYDEAYRPTQQTIKVPTSEAGLGGTYTYTTSYKVDGSLAGTTFPAAADLPAEDLAIRYDETSGLPMRLESSYGAGISYVSKTTYDDLSRVTQYELRTDTGTDKKALLSLSRERDTGRFVKTVTERNALAPNTLSEATYGHDPAGNITQIADAATGDTQCFQYDYLRRLTQAWTPSAADCAAAPTSAGLGGPAPYWHSWTYDKVGNRRTEEEHATPGGGSGTSTTYTYPDAATARPHALTGKSVTVNGATVTTGYTYDEIGNTLTRPTSDAGTQTLTWDPEGHLATSADNTGTTTYIYDADGNRLVQRDPTGSTLHLPDQEIRYTKASTAKTATRYYSLSGSTLASRTASGLSWLSVDHQGTATIAIDEATHRADIRRQTPFGSSRGTSPSSWPNSKGFVGGILDKTGLTHLGAREYDSQIGRFISVDPVQDLADPQQWNGYAYGGNSPVTFSDPTGLLGSACTGMCATYSNYYTGLAAESRTPSGEKSTSQKVVEFGTGVKDGWNNWVGDTFNGVKSFVSDPVGSFKSAFEESIYWEEKYNSDGKFVGPYSGHIGAACVLTGACDIYENLKAGNYYEAGYDTGSMALDVTVGVATSFVGGEIGSVAGSIARRVATRIGKAVKTPCSFSASTGVLLADGTSKPISELAVGDEVLATDPETGEQASRKITAVIVHDDQLSDLVIDGKAVTTTEDHPFWNDTDREWQPAAALSPGDHLLGPDGSTAEVRGLRIGPALPARAYNLTIDDVHTYYVLAGTTPVLVHNVCDPEGLARAAQAAKSFDRPGGTSGSLYLDGVEGATDLSSGWRNTRPGYQPPAGAARGYGHHVESQAVDEMIRSRSTNATLYINNPKGACPVCWGTIEDMLPTNSRLRVVWATEYGTTERIFVGN